MTISSEALYNVGTHLNFVNMVIDDPSNPSILRLRLKALKTDPFHGGMDIFIVRTNNKLCPIEAMMACLVKREEGKVFYFSLRTAAY